MSTSLFLDRSLVLQIWQAGKRNDLKSEALLRAVADIVARYDLVYFELQGGVSLMRSDLFGMAMFKNKLSVLPGDAVVLLPDEKPLLSASIEAFGRDPIIQQGLQQYHFDTRAVTRSDSEVVLGYIMRLLLLGRSLKADIYPWSARVNLMLAVFRAAGCPAERTRLSDSADLVTFTCHGFPYTGPAGNAAERVSFGIVAQEAAADAPCAHVEIARAVDVRRNNNLDKIRILFLAANPIGTPQLKLDNEAREIEMKIRASTHRDTLELITRWAVRPDDLLQHLNQFAPHVVHFSGHGSSTEEITLLDNAGEPKPVGKEALLSLFRTLRDNIRIVLLNACYSRPQAEAMTGVIDCAIGMKRAIGDQAAITFAASFYRAIGFGRSVRDAFDQGKTALLLEGMPEDKTPSLLTRATIAPEEIILINPR